MIASYVVGEPATLSFGSSIVLISTLNEDGSANLAPIPSAIWLGWRCILGLANSTSTAHNLKRSNECVLNLPSVNEAGAVDRLDILMGDREPAESIAFEAAGLTPVASLSVVPPGVLECPIQLEAVLSSKFDVMQDEPKLAGHCSAYELRITRVHFKRTILVDGDSSRVDASKWSPLAMKLHGYYGLSAMEICQSRQSEMPERQFGTPDIERAREESFERLLKVVRRRLVSSSETGWTG
jgi:flavin reductase (DIM6/NTAB) family NADH-FMN oxidoreductase RutF